jgi:Fe-S cluster biogenesis protein NfuA
METTVKQIEAILNEKVRPILKEHGGNVTIQSLEHQILKVKLTGKCISISFFIQFYISFIKPHIVCNFYKIQ